MIPKNRDNAESLEDMERLTESDLDEMADHLPTYPPLPIEKGNDVTVKEFHPDLTDEELDFLYKAYTEKYGGTMRKDGDWQPPDANM